MLPCALGSNSKSLTKKKMKRLKITLIFSNVKQGLTPKYHGELKNEIIYTKKLSQGGMSLRNVKKVERLKNELYSPPTSLPSPVLTTNVDLLDIFDDFLLNLLFFLIFYISWGNNIHPWNIVLIFLHYKKTF